MDIVTIFVHTIELSMFRLIWLFELFIHYFQLNILTIILFNCSEFPACLLTSLHALSFAKCSVHVLQLTRRVDIFYKSMFFKLFELLHNISTYPLATAEVTLGYKFPSLITRSFSILHVVLTLLPLSVQFLQEFRSVSFLLSLSLYLL